MPLTNLTKAQLRTKVLTKLGDLSAIHWTNDEINHYISEALYTFGAIANYWKEFININSVPGEVYYNLNTIVTSPGDELNFHLTVDYILKGINFHLIEAIGDATPTSEFISLDEILGLIKNKISEMQLIAGLVITKSIIALASPPIKEVILDDAVIDVIRVMYQRADDSKFYVLKRDSENNYETMDSEDFTNITKNPDWFSTLLTDTDQELKIYPSAAVNGTLELLTVNACEDLEDSTTLLPFIDNLIPYIKWGVMAEILNKDGILNDPNRAAYCLQRWNEGKFIAQNYTSVLKAYINDLPVSVDSIDNIDSMDSNWRNQTPTDAARMLGIAGYNMIIPDRIPSAVDQAWTFNSIVNAPIPNTDGDFVQIKEEYYEAFVNYICHLALFKDGITDLKRTNSYLQDYLRVATMHNQRLADRGINYATLLDKTKIQETELSKPLVETPYQNGNQQQ